MRLALPARPAVALAAVTLAAVTLAAAAPRPAAAQAAFAPAAPATAPASGWTGVYRVDMTNGNEVVPLRVVVERVGDRLTATALVDGTAVALDAVRSDGGELRASMPTSAGRGALVLRATDRGVAGTLRVGRATWTLAGERSA